MGNTLTAVLPSIQQAADSVAREFVGYIPAVFRNSSAERAGLNDTITYDVVPAMTAADITPGATSSSGTDQIIGSGTMSISKSRKVSFHWTGEQSKSMSNSPLQGGILQRQFEQAFRTIANEVEADLHSAAYKAASRAVGTAGATPFGTAADLSDFANTARILDENGAPVSDRHFVAGSAAVANLRGKQSVLFKANEAGDGGAFLRTGAIGEVMGFFLHNSNPITQVTKGTGASYVTSGSTAVGVTDIALVTGTGTVLAGDVVTFAADANNKYVIGTGVAAPGTISLNKPGAKVVIATANALTVGNSYTPNVAFCRDAIHLITRAPAMPPGGDEADDVVEVTDSFTGLTFQIALYRQYRQVSFEVGLAWGQKAVKSEYIATCMG